MANHPEDTALIRERDTSRARAADAEREAGVADAAGDRPRAAAMRQQAGELARAAEAADHQLRLNEERRRAVLANTVTQRQAAAASDTSLSR